VNLAKVAGAEGTSRTWTGTQLEFLESLPLSDVVILGLASSMDGPVLALAMLSDGTLVVGGNFSTVRHLALVFAFLCVCVCVCQFIFYRIV